MVAQLADRDLCRARFQRASDMRVLLIEDDTAFAKSIELMLRSEGIEVCLTELGDEGILLSKLFYDIIVLDLQLPDMNGFEVLKTVRRLRIKTPVMILSGNAIAETKVEALSYGADDYVTKPIHKDELVARIRAVVRRSKGRTQPFAESGELIVDLKANAVEVEGVRSRLTGEEAQTLFQALAPFLSPLQQAVVKSVAPSAQA